MFLIGIIAIVILFSCAINYPTNRNEHAIDKQTRDIVGGKVYEFTYKQHSYIGFLRYKEWGVVHDPECKCFKK